MVLALLTLLLAAVRLRYGGGRTGFPDRTTAALLAGGALEVVADLDRPPGNLAVAADGRVFFSFHPEARPEVKVAELVAGRPVPWPSADWQGPGRGEVYFDTVLALRIDRQGRLWTLDNADHGLGQPRILAFDLGSGELVHRFDVPSEIAGLGSHLNDFQVDPEGRFLYLADASIFAQTPALVVYDAEARTARRLLAGHPSVLPDPYIPVVQGRVMRVLGVFAVRPGVDSIALDRRGEWLYFAAVTAERMYRARAADLRDAALPPETLAARVETVAPKTMSDGIATDLADHLYLTDLEHSAIVRLAPDGGLETLVRDPRLRWPDGLSFGPDGWLYITASALHQIIGRLPSAVDRHAPYQIFRFRPGVEGVPGH